MTYYHTNYILTKIQLNQIKKLYLENNSAQEIKEILKLPHTTRTIQRRLKAMGIMRNHRDSFNIAIKKRRVIYQTKPKDQLIYRKSINARLRYQVLEKYNNRCIICGNTSKEARIQIDHIDENPKNNDISNLQVLCEPCNKGKAALNNKFFNPIIKKG